jgi:2-oxoisovalerate dehydrogenase E1 component
LGTNVTIDWTNVAALVARSRALDELEENELAPSGEVPYQFSAKGHELAQVLLGLQLTHPHDAVGVYYRSRPLLLTAGLTLEEALAAGMGKAGSPSEGRDVGVVFSMPPRSGPTVLPSSGDVGAQYTPVAGWAQAIRYRTTTLQEQEWEGAIAVALGGDGSVATNGFWSALTMASTLKLPMLFFIEDNEYGLSVPSHFNTPGGDIAQNLKSFKNLLVLNGSGTDPELTGELVTEAVDHVRGGESPCLLRLTVPRLSGHTFVDNQAYKHEEQRQSEASRDPLTSLEKLLGEDVVVKLLEQAAEEVRLAADAAREQARQDLGSARKHLFFEGVLQNIGGISPEIGPRDVPEYADPNQVGPRINLIEAVRSVLAQELEQNLRAVVFGEDVGVKGGVHGATVDLQIRFGAERVFDTSLSEEGIIGRAVGIALAGLLPIPEIQFRKYADPAMEQINDCGTIRWRTAGRFAAPMVVRIPVGFSKKVGDPWHSVTGEAIFAHTLGWRLAFPSNAADAAGLLRTALRAEDPTLFFEHRALLDSADSRRPDPGENYLVPFGKAAVIAQGDEVTLVTWGAMVYPSLQAAERFDGRVEVIDLRTISPWDQDSVLASVRKTGRCLIVHEDTWTGGFAGEIIATLADHAFASLDAPPKRLTTPDIPIPYAKELMISVLPDEDRIVSELEALLAF